MKELLCALFLLLASATAQVESRFHGTVFRVPDGWRSGDQKGVLMLAPTDLQRSPEIAVFILPGADVRVNFQTDFDQFVEKALAAETVLSAQPLEQTQPAGYDVKSRLVLVKNGPNARAVRWFVGSNPGGRFEMVLVAASSEAVFRRYDRDLKVLFGSLSYPSAHATPGRAPAVPADGATPQAAPAAVGGSLVGRWRSGSVSSMNFYNPATGHWAAPSGAGTAYAFEPDGTYTQTGLLQTSMYGCTTTFFSWSTGKYTVKGNQLTLNESGASGKFTNTCNPSSDHGGSRALAVEHLVWCIQRDRIGLVLGLLDPSKKYGEIQYRPE